LSNYTRTIVYVSETAVDGTATGNTLITQSRESQLDSFFALDVRAATLQSVNVQTPCTISIGTNFPTLDNICSTQSISGSAGQLRTLTVNPSFTGVPELTNIGVKVVTAATPVPATTATLTFRIALVGLET
jgi:hypothetical protein